MKDMKRIIAVLALVMVSVSIFSQEEKEVSEFKELKVDGKPVYVVVEEMPEFPGGQDSLRNFIAQTVEYPEVSREMDVQGRVFVEFVVNYKGEVCEAKIVRSVDKNLDMEALRVIKALPNWKPGYQRGEPVNVKFTLPINFKLSKVEDGEKKK